MRGRIGSGRPLSIPDAVWHVDAVPQMNVVLNTPFCILRSVSSDENVLIKHTFFSPEQLLRMRSSIHLGKHGDMLRKNVVIIMIESGGASFVESLDINADPDENMLGIMPFLDSIASESLVNVHTLATGKSSVGGVTSVFGGFPSFAPLLYAMSPYASNPVDSPARLLTEEGYDTRFYYGCNHGSFNIDQMAHLTGFDKVMERDEYGDDADYDGTWGIYDHAMGRWAAVDMSSLKEPFFAGWFTLTSHAPYKLPDYIDMSDYKHVDRGPLKSMEYVDRALRGFFTEASKQPWYNNTLFIITADHGCRDLSGTRYDTPYLMHHIPFIVYSPDGSVSAHRIDDRAMSQFDIVPTMLGLLNYNKNYVSIGTDLLDDAVDHYAIYKVDGEYHVCSDKYVITLNPDNADLLSVFDVSADPEMKTVAVNYDKTEIDRMQRWAKSFLQDYTHRMIGNRMSIINERR